MLPSMASSVHNVYTKFAQIYAKLQVEHQNIYQRFEDGYHVDRESDSIWADLSIYLIIEQVLMRNIKTSSGLPRWRGMTEH